MNKIIGTLVIFALIVIGGVSLIGKKEVSTFGSVNVSDAYLATTTESSWANIPHMIASSTNGIPNIQMVGSIIIGTTHASIVEIKDATSSTDVSSTTIAILAASPANGSTLTLDARILRGLMINTPTGFAGRYTITYK